MRMKYPYTCLDPSRTEPEELEGRISTLPGAPTSSPWAKYRLAGQVVSTLS
ncbi:hypothetical protein B7P43_G11422 [Cryptotermes secundus]|uniref:Uncharacterized protein n=1 Tax=Cryptotermes secundus TaxID=105785 RepID=A0A2J7QYQ8_9NEOP|nr:hypothetical protein B7P43_G11422 [Cryptotermes secundus]